MTRHRRFQRARRKLRVAIIGAGKVGTALALGLRRRGHPIVAVISRTGSSARSCARLVKCRIASTRLSDLPSTTECLLLSVPDEQISYVASKLAQTSLSTRNLTIFHTSGVLTSDELRPLSAKGALVFSLHPIQRFSDKRPHPALLNGISYGFEGPSRAFWVARQLVADLRGSIFRIPKKEKILYHTACVFAANYLTVVLGTSGQLLPDSLGRNKLKSVAPLATSALASALSHSPSEALTGPIARGSSHVVRLHLHELKKRRKSLVRLYKELGLQALELARHDGAISRMKAGELRKILSTRR